VTDERNEHPALAPLAIGLSLAMIHFATIPLTGTSVNPARSIGPALFAGGDAILQLWLFIVAPLVGGALAGLLYPAVFGRHSEPVAGSGLRVGRRAPADAVPGYGAPDAYQQQWNQQPGDQPYPPQAPAPGQPWPQPGQQWQSPRDPQYPKPPPQQSWPQPGDLPDDGQTRPRPPG
jgi:aquaporin Z